MRQLHHPLRPDTANAAAVYLINRTDRRRFKVGWSFDPLHRARQLPEFSRGELDLRSSCALWLPSRKRARQVERAMHKCLAPYQVRANHDGDGHSEWFAPIALHSAVQLLREMPGDGPLRGGRRAERLEPLLTAQRYLGLVETTESPQDVWYGVEDLWLRISAELPVRAEGEESQWSVRVAGFRHACDGQMRGLRERALDSEAYTWRLAGERGAFVRLIAYEGDDLVFTGSALAAIERWPGGQELGWQVRGLLARLRTPSRKAPRLAAVRGGGESHDA